MAVKVINITPMEMGENCEGTRCKIVINYPTAKDIQEETNKIIDRYNKKHKSKLVLVNVTASYDRFNSPSYLGFFNVLTFNGKCD
jgi:hypothetical protein